MRVVFIGNPSRLNLMQDFAGVPTIPLSLVVSAYRVSRRAMQINEAIEAAYFDYMVIDNREIEKVKWTATKELKVVLQKSYIKFTSKSKEFKKTFYDFFNGKNST